MILEPICGAHSDPEVVATHLKKTLIKYIKELSLLPPDKLLDHRYKKFRTIGEYIDQQKEQLDNK